MPALPVIVLSDVTKTYRMGEVTVEALRGVDLQIEPREFVVLLGPSGSGKTTILNLIGGLDRPTSGSIVVAGEEVTSFSDRQLTAYRRDEIGFVFQFFNLIPTLTARENILFALELTQSDRRENAERASSLLDLVGLGDRGDHFPAQLSGGEQQRVAIARALANRPPVVLCDEPTGNLDVDTGKHVLQVMRDLNAHEDTTVVLVTHNQAIAAMADRVIRLHNGTIRDVHVNPEPAPVAGLNW